jgi:hypothetical protein
MSHVRVVVVSPEEAHDRIAETPRTDEPFPNAGSRVAPLSGLR